MSYRGAKDIRFHRFSGGLVEDTDATELGAEQCAACENVDLKDEVVRKRLGRVAYNSTAPSANPVGGIGIYHEADGGRLFALAVAQNLYADLNNDGDFGDASENFISTSYPVGDGLVRDRVDFMQFRNRMYINYSHATLIRWFGSTAAASVAKVTAPAAAPTIAGSQTLLESFEDHTDWTVVAGPGTGSIAKADESGLAVGTDACLKLTVSATNQQRSYLHKSFASTQDLSGVQKLVLWGRSNVAKLQIKVGIYEDGDTVGTTAVDWDKFPVLTFETADQWEAFEIPLAGIAPTSRDAVPGMAVMYLTGGGTAAEIYLDDLKPALDLDPGTYEYSYTYYDSRTDQESEPSAAAVLDVSADAPLKHVNITVVASAGTNWNGDTLDKVRLYRKRRDGADVFGGEGVLVKEAANASATYTDTKTVGQLVTEFPARLREHRTTPPKGATAAIVNNRLLTGNIYDSSATTLYKYRLHLSRFNKPEEFGAEEYPEVDPLGPGYIDMPDKDTIVRIVEAFGGALIFCDRSVYALTGDGWDNFKLIKRADVGLDARWAVAVTDQVVFFLSGDGVRAMVPEAVDAEGKFRTWVISEPVESRVQGIVAAYRHNAAMGVDHQGRVHLSYTSTGTVNDKGLVFDPRAKGALSRGENPLRPGWTYYTNWGFSCFASLKRGVKIGSTDQDNGQLLGGDPSTGKLHYLLRSRLDAALETDDGSDIAWSWTSRAVDAGSEGLLEIEGVFAEFDPAANEEVTASLILDRDTSAPVTSTLSLGAATTGIRAIRNRVPLGTSARYAQLKLSGEQGVALKVRSAGIAVYRRR